MFLKKLFKAKVPNLKEYLGRTVIIDGKPIKIETLVFNRGMMIGRAPKDQRPQYLEINGEYRISALRFFAQMTGAKDISEEQFRQFEEAEYYSEKMSDDLKVDPEALARGEVKFLEGKKH